MAQPDSTTPGSIMPRYPHLLTTPFDTGLIQSKLHALRTVGVPYSDGEIETAVASMQNQANAIAKEVESQQGPTGLADKEIVALVAYLQRLGTDIRWKRPEPQGSYSATLQLPAAQPAPAAAAADPASGTPAVQPHTPTARSSEPTPAAKPAAAAHSPEPAPRSSASHDTSRPATGGPTQ